jgi:hypothetical protein
MMCAGQTDLSATVLVGRLLSDDVPGDIPGRRHDIAREIIARTQTEFPACQMRALWVLNRIRDPDLLQRFRDTLQCRGPGTPVGGQATLFQSGLPNTEIIEIPFRATELAMCEDEQAALRYLTNPNLARNAILDRGAAQKMRYTFVLDGDIYVPAETFRQAAALTDNWTADDPVWLFTMRAASLEDFFADYVPGGSRRELTDTCESRFVLNSWPPETITIGDEGMLGLPGTVAPFDIEREYGNDPKVVYCQSLKTTAPRLAFVSYPVCHLEHRTLPDLPSTLSGPERDSALLDHRIAMRRIAVCQALRLWRDCRELR